MYRSVRLPYLAVLMPLLFLVISTSASADFSLKDALDAALEKQKNQFVSADTLNIDEADFISWLDGAPFVSVSALRSQNALGTDEAEVGLTLPIKSQLRRNIEKKLQLNSLLLKENTERQLALYLSGQIRELVWEAQMLSIKISAAEKKIEMLNSLNDLVHALSESRAVPEYIALLLEKESIDSALTLLDHEYQSSNLVSEFTRLTGLRALPSNIQEKFEPTASFSIVSHPDIALLDGVWDYFAGTFQAANNKAEPWHLSVIARRVEEPAFDENQIGIGVEIPLSVGNQYSHLQHYEYVKAQAEYQLTRQTLGNTLSSAFEQARLELDYLTAKQVLLNTSDAPISKLEQVIPTLLQANLENKESVIRSALEVIDARAKIELNRIAMQKQYSMLKQAAGIAI